MKEYHKIQSIYKRDNQRKFIIGKYSTPELDMLKNLNWNWFEKVEGVNLRITFDPEMENYEPFIVRGRTDNPDFPVDFVDNIKSGIFDRIDLFNKVRDNAKNSPFTLYGEGVGLKQMSNRFNSDFKEYNYILFDVMVGNWWLEDRVVESIANTLGYRYAPLVNQGTIDNAIEFVKTHPRSLLGETQFMEGVVLKPPVQIFNRKNERIITKVKVDDFKKK